MDQSIILIVLAIGLIFVVFYFRKKKKMKSKYVVSNRKTKDEVWQTIKEFLRSKNRSGLEIIDCFPVKRISDTTILPYLPLAERQKKRQLLKLINWYEDKHPTTFSTTKVKDKDAYYVVCFQVRNNKTNETSMPEAFECKVKKVQVSKTETKQKIVITNELDFNKEMEWISPIRTNDIKKNEANIKHEQKIRDRMFYQQIAMNEKKMLQDFNAKQ